MNIDADKDLPEIIMAVLVQNGYQCVVYYDAESSIRDVKKQKPDLIPVDLMLPA
jgi:DNA-binding response OmpR family regulator